MTNLHALNPQQREAVVSEEKRLLVLAGAGSGKTKTLLQKIIYLIEEKSVSPLDILAITFTKNAANEMLDRLILVADKTGEYEAIIHEKKSPGRKRTRQDALLSRVFQPVGKIVFVLSVLRGERVGITCRDCSMNFSR